MKRISVFVVAFVLIATVNIIAQVKLSPIFSDGMVLQQQTNVKIWGKATPNRKVLVVPSWSKKKYWALVNADSTWSVHLQTPVGSYKNYSISIKEGRTTVLSNIAIGEVWLAGGQSNMEMEMKGFPNQPILNALNDIANSSNDFIRFFRVKKSSKAQLMDTVSGDWKAASPNNTSEFSATAYYFGRQINKVLQVPIGIINCNWGGSTIEAWMSDEAIASFPAKVVVRSDLEIVPSKANRYPTTLYKGMLHPIVGYAMRGVIWYQGESNKDDYKEYPALFKAMHADWIERWKIGDFPIYMCQIAPFQYGYGVSSAFIREAQMKIAESQPSTATAVLMDVGEQYCIHPANKQVAGERLAYLAMNKSYGMNAFVCEAPKYDSYSIKDSTILIKMRGVHRGFTTFAKPIKSFKIAGEDRVFHEGKVRFRGLDVIEIWSPNVKLPVAARYAFDDFVVGDLFSVEGFPVSSFRTDDWE